MDASSKDGAELSFDQIMELEARAEARDQEPDDVDPAGHDSDGAEIVLPWYQHPVNIVTMVVTAAILAVMIGFMVGGNSQVRHNEVDTGFLQDMREHHEQAELLGFVYRDLPDTDPGMRNVATGIIRSQGREVGRMIQLLRDFGEDESNQGDSAMNWMGMSSDVGRMPGMASDEEIAELGRSSGSEADELFAELMIVHHLGGIEMADFAAENGENAEVILMAESMSIGQRGEIAEMESLID